jgi:hypothetical protein
LEQPDHGHAEDREVVSAGPTPFPQSELQRRVGCLTGVSASDDNV